MPPLRLKESSGRVSAYTQVYAEPAEMLPVLNHRKPSRRDALDSLKLTAENLILQRAISNHGTWEKSRVIELAQVAADVVDVLFSIPGTETEFKDPNFRFVSTWDPQRTIQTIPYEGRDVPVPMVSGRLCSSQLPASCFQNIDSNGIVLDTFRCFRIFTGSLAEAIQSPCAETNK